MQQPTSAPTLPTAAPRALAWHITERRGPAARPVRDQRDPRYWIRRRPRSMKRPMMHFLVLAHPPTPSLH
jgi:hypothetical protein